MVNPRRIYYYDDDEGMEYVHSPYTYENYHAFEGYNVGSVPSWRPSQWEGYNEGAYRGGWNDDLQAGARRRWREDQRRGRQNQPYRRAGEENGPYVGRGPRNYVRSDARILDEVNYRLTMDGRVNASHIAVAVSGGVVVLDGSVPDRRQKRAAEDAADTVAGVKDVDNRLKISMGEA